MASYLMSDRNKYYVVLGNFLKTFYNYINIAFPRGK